MERSAKRRAENEAAFREAGARAGICLDGNSGVFTDLFDDPEAVLPVDQDLGVGNEVIVARRNEEPAWVLPDSFVLGLADPDGLDAGP